MSASSFDYPSILPMVELDSDQMQIVFQNIILNAVEAMPDGGNLNIRIEILSTRKDNQKDVAFLKVSFRDTGSGISESDLVKYLILILQVLRHAGLDPASRKTNFLNPPG
jgi:signal transduction histidine kinase